jgi:hypothetical protein
VSYRETLAGEKETSLTIRCDRASFTLAGKIKASQFRGWCLERLDQLVTVVKGFRENVPEYLKIRDLSNADEILRFTPAGRKPVLKLVEALLIAKRAPGMGPIDLGLSPVEIVLTLGRAFQVQLPLECAESGCDELGYLACPQCQSRIISLQGSPDAWELVCAQQGHRWSCSPPIRGSCARDHPFTLDGEDIADRLELLPGEDLLHAISDLIKKHIPGDTFDSQADGFFIRGRNLHYVDNRAELESLKSQQPTTVYHIQQTIGTAMGGSSVIAVQQGASAGSSS